MASAPAALCRSMPHMDVPAVLALATASDGTAQLDVFGTIGDYGLRAEDFKNAISGLTASKLIVNLNSPGGDVFAGVAAYNLLVDSPAEIEIRVYGLAASAASVIAMAGDNILMGDGSFIMIHNAWALAVGDTREMAAMARTLGQIDKELAKLYAQRTGLDIADVTDMMDAETWLSAEDAIDQNFADGMIAADSGAATNAAYDLSAFKNVPKALKARKRSAKASKAAVLPTPQPENLSPVLAALERLNSSMRV